ncbi:MAG: valine--tRNA ligase [Phycisphaerales bacterium]|nr:valine--tRNA ligase [Phycisphaerales bacterium]
MAEQQDIIPKSYAPSEVESEILSKWDDSDVNAGDPRASGDPYSIVIPPPNVTAPLHLGHALNNTLQDVLIRYHRMCGFSTLWIPGTDHAGIATQSVVEKRLMQQEGKKRTDFERDEFIARVQAWKDEYQATILSQLRSMGTSCDWDRTRFTMDDMCADAVREAFFKLFSDGLIYRGKRLVNWDPVTLTALADDEVEMQDVLGHMYYLRYPLDDGSGFVTVATTRPETMLGDTAVAVNPNDPRAKALRGKAIRLPIVDRIIPIIEDEYVVMQGGDDPKAAMSSGFLKVTPAHDPNDWAIGLRHQLEVINVMAPDASMSDAHGWEDVSDEAKQFLGLSREDARESILAWFKENDLLEGVREYNHSVGHSYRSHVPIEPYLSDQWYVRVTDDRLSGEALRALSPNQYEGTPPKRESGNSQGDGELSFYPSRYAHTFQSWHENLQDWCISRQLWWGHRIPVWSKTFTSDAPAQWPCQDHTGLHAVVEDPDAEGITRVSICVAGGNDELETTLEKAGFVRDVDVLDTWFSSALWPISTMGWPNPEKYPETEGLLDTFNPTSVLCTGRDIITLWVSRMVMFNRYFRGGTLPFGAVFINPMIQDGFGQRMSKSLGNGVDPRDIIQTHGADAMRLTMVQLATGTQDVRLGVDLICPHSGKSFVPKYITSHTGHTVMAPMQSCPEDSSKTMSTVYGNLIGETKDCTQTPLAMNTSTRFDVGRNFANKFWNASRFALMNISNPSEIVNPSTRPPVDQWILSRTQVAINRINQAMKEYKFSEVTESLYDFLWRDLCDWYLETIKPTVKDDPEQQRILHTVLDALCRVLHPVCPFVTEAMWTHVQNIPAGSVVGIEMASSALVATAPWPIAGDLSLCQDEIDSFEAMRDLVTAIRGCRAEQNVKPKRKIHLYAAGETLELAKKHEVALAAVAGLERIAPIEDSVSGTVIPFGSDRILLANLLDEEESQAACARLEQEIEALEKRIGALRGKLSNKGYVDNAPPALVEETRELLAQAEAELALAKETIAS